jgi:hypothetical protein
MRIYTTLFEPRYQVIKISVSLRIYTTPVKPHYQVINNEALQQ